MSKYLFKKYLPHPDIIVKNRWIKLLGPRLQESGLWHINRKSCSSGVAVGVFCAFVPIPFQMLLAAIASILLRSNILVAVPMVWISNPITMPPMFYFCYLVGAQILNSNIEVFAFELSFTWLLTGLLEIWQPFLLGCLVVGFVTSALSFILIRVLWRLHILTHIKNRKIRKTQKSTS
jgi:uncharacterized protein (DUF2062 family)|tara:strand:+ start:859 stop:1389 length:531 start_codon:yes stop_codon:yes gene_type:complete